MKRRRYHSPEVLLYYLRPLMGFLTLSALVLTLLGFTMYEAWVLHSIGGFVVAIVLAGAILAMVRERRRLACVLPTAVDWRALLLAFAGVVGGALVAYVLSVDVGLGAVTASALVALIAAFILPDYDVPIYCGSFVGMTSARLLASYGELAIAGIIAGLLYVLTISVYPGCGGKLGTIAFGGSAITGLGLAREFPMAEIPAWPVVWLIVAHAVVATVITYWVNVGLGRGPVIASGLVGIVGGLILPPVYPEIGETLAVMVICASFAGMSSAQRFPSYAMMFAVGFVAGIIFVYSMPLAGGAGGKLGTIAFGAVLAVCGWCDLVGTFVKRRSISASGA